MRWFDYLGMAFLLLRWPGPLWPHNLASWTLRIYDLYQDWHNYDVLDFGLLCWPPLPTRSSWTCFPHFANDSQETISSIEHSRWHCGEPRKPFKRKLQKKPGARSKVSGAGQEECLGLFSMDHGQLGIQKCSSLELKVFPVFSAIRNNSDKALIPKRFSFGIF